jgi:hypothetical protein
MNTHPRGYELEPERGDRRPAYAAKDLAAQVVNAWRNVKDPMTVEQRLATLEERVAQLEAARK